MIIFMCGSNECMQQIYECMLLSNEVREKRDQTDRKKQKKGNNKGTSAALAEL